MDNFTYYSLYWHDLGTHHMIVNVCGAVRGSIVIRRYCFVDGGVEVIDGGEGDPLTKRSDRRNLGFHHQTQGNFPTFSTIHNHIPTHRNNQEPYCSHSFQTSNITHLTYRECCISHHSTEPTKPDNIYRSTPSSTPHYRLFPVNCHRKLLQHRGLHILPTLRRDGAVRSWSVTRSSILPASSESDSDSD